VRLRTAGVFKRLMSIASGLLQIRPSRAGQRAKRSAGQPYRLRVTAHHDLGHASGLATQDGLVSEGDSVRKYRGAVAAALLLLQAQRHPYGPARDPVALVEVNIALAAPSGRRAAP